MVRMIVAVFLLVAFGTPAVGAAQQLSSAPATFVSVAELMAVLKKSADRTGSDVTAQKVSAGPNNVLVNIGHRTKEGATMEGTAHSDLTEIYHVIEGAGTVVTGGTFVNPQPSGANTRGTIQNGHAQRITVGDVVVIPVGTPHTFSEIESTLVFLNIRINPK